METPTSRCKVPHIPAPVSCSNKETGGYSALGEAALVQRQLEQSPWNFVQLFERDWTALNSGAQQRAVLCKLLTPILPPGARAPVLDDEASATSDRAAALAEAAKTSLEEGADAVTSSAVIADAGPEAGQAEPDSTAPLPVAPVPERLQSNGDGISAPSM